MEQQPPPYAAVYVSASRHECAERSLVLQSVGIRHDLRPARDGYALIVGRPDVERAEHELAAYAVETRNWPPRPKPIPTLGDGWSGVLVYVIVLIGLAMLSHGQAVPEVAWFPAGRMHADAVLDGEWWRTITALTLHIDAIHLAGNVVFGSIFGLFAGQLLGSGVAWLSIVIAGAAGNAINAWIQKPDHTSVGASTAVFACLGIMAAFPWQRRRSHGYSRGQSLVPIVSGVVLLSFMGLGEGRTDVMAHVCGFACGMLLGAVLGAWGGAWGSSVKLQGGCGLLALAVLVAGWLAAIR